MMVFKKEEVAPGVHIRRMVVSAMFLAIALVIRTLFRMYIPIFGESGLRISLHGIFSFMPAILFGPVYGAIVAGLSDFLGHHLRPTGAFIPYLTVTSTLAGYFRGLLWIMLRDKSTEVMRNIVVMVSIVVLAIGAYNAAALSADGIGRGFYEPFTLGTEVNAAGATVHIIDRDAIDTTGMSMIGRMAITRSIGVNNPGNVLNEFIALVSTAMIGAGVFGLLLVVLDWTANRFLFTSEWSVGVPTMNLLAALMVPAVVVNTVNTEILRHTAFPSWQLLPFTVVWFPRVMQAVGTTLIVVYFVAVLLGVLKRQANFREWMR